VNGAQYLQESAARMAADGSAVTWVPLRGGVVLMGYQSEFRIQWAASKLHLFTAAVSVPVATPEIVTSFAREVGQYAKATKGRLRGLQTGVATIPAVVAEVVTPQARADVEKVPGREFGAFCLPVVVDLADRAVYSFPGTAFWGVLFVPWLRKRLAAAFPPPG